MENKNKSIEERAKELLDSRKAQIKVEEEQREIEKEQEEGRIEIICEEIKNIEERYSNKEFHNFLKTFGEKYKLSSESYVKDYDFYGLPAATGVRDINRTGIEIKSPYPLYMVCYSEPNIKLVDKNDKFLIFKKEYGRFSKKTVAKACFPDDFLRLVKNSEILPGKITESIGRGIEELIKKAEKKVGKNDTNL